MTATYVEPVPLTQTTPAAGHIPKGRRLAFMNNKGGVGKTTVMRELAGGLARRGRTVLAIDMDPQGNITRRLGVRLAPGQYTMAEALAEKRKGGLADVIVSCGWDSPEAALIDVAPATLELEERGKEISQLGAHQRLRRIAYGVTDGYDYTLIDCRPSMGPLEEMVIPALDSPGDGIYVPIEPGHDAISGAGRIIDIVTLWAGDAEVPCTVLGVIVNMTDMQTVLHQARVESLPDAIRADGRPDVPILEPHIPRAVHLAEVQDQATPATGHKDFVRTRKVHGPEGELTTTISMQNRIDMLAALIDGDNQ